MFGWEFPPNLSGGLGTACFGLTRSLLKIDDIKLLFVMPNTTGEEHMEGMHFVNANDIYVADNKLANYFEKDEMQKEQKWINIKAPVSISPYSASGLGMVEQENISHWSYKFKSTYHAPIEGQNMNKFKLTGKYGKDLLNEVHLYSLIGQEIGKLYDFDIIHAHDWLTYMAGIAAKRVSGKPLIIHVHATEYDRAGEVNIDKRIYNIEHEGMLEADRIIAVSHWTKNIITSKYHIDPEKITVVHNGIERKESEYHSKEQLFLNNPLITFLGRITYQKGPVYFIEAAKKVLKKFPNTHFVMAGSGDLLPQMIEHVARLQISSHFHFTGFLNKDQVDRIWSLTNLFVMPSVSEPFGIVPLEAVQAGVPVIISNQSGVSEVLDDAIKVDFWDVEALSDAICAVLKYNGLHSTLKKESTEKVKNITWDIAAIKINKIYNDVIN